MHKICSKFLFIPSLVRMRSPVRIRVSAPVNRFCEDVRRGDFPYVIRVCRFFLLSCPVGAVCDRHRAPANLGTFFYAEPANFGRLQTFDFMQRMNALECQLTIPANTQKSLHQAYGFAPCIRFCNSACRSPGVCSSWASSAETSALSLSST